MKIITINRDSSTDKGTLGTLSIDGVILCQTLERPWVDANGDLISDKMVSCINSGIYKARVRESKKFGTVIEILNVPNRTAILIHPANRVQELQGCVAVGMIRGDENGEPCVYKSKVAMARLIEIVKGEKDLEIRII